MFLTARFATCYSNQSCIVQMNHRLTREVQGSYLCQAIQLAHIRELVKCIFFILLSQWKKEIIDESRGV